jgi:small subunit ribosomal protein S9
MTDEERQDPPEGEAPENEEPTGEPGPEIEIDLGGAEQAPAEEEDPPAEEPPAPAEAAEEQPLPAEEPPAPAEEPAEAPAAVEPPAERPQKERKQEQGREEVIPGAHLEPDLVLEGDREQQADPYADPEAEGDADEAVADAPAEDQPVEVKVIDLAADARYAATGKRKSAVARVILKPGQGSYTVNGRELDQFFPRPTLQKVVRSPLDTAGYSAQMDVVARIHGGGVSSQAGALRHGIARALVEAEPSLRGDLKRRGFLTRDPRVKERKKAGLKKARKRPQFSKR